MFGLHYQLHKSLLFLILELGQPQLGATMPMHMVPIYPFQVLCLSILCQKSICIIKVKKCV